MKIYTRTGDDGKTGLLGGVRVSKSHLAIDVVGALDETNCWLGKVCGQSVPESVHGDLIRIQNDLFVVGSGVAACLSKSEASADFSGDRVAWLEGRIDRYDQQLPPLKAFILPGGCPAGSDLHLARAICRRAERQMVALIESGVGHDFRTKLTYLNRLADLLFVMARTVNADSGHAETRWST